MRVLLPFAALTFVSLAATPAVADEAGGGVLSITETVAASYAIYNPSLGDYARGRTALAEGRYADAALLLEPLAAMGLDPELKLLAGYANLGSGRIGKAEDYFGAALGLDSRSPFARHGLGLTSLARGDRTGAQAQIVLLEGAAARCGSCDRSSDIAKATASLRRALGS
jgi:tetratricopeptide (TPR) repeat protein